MSWSTHPLLAFDVASTGLDTSTVRIVTAALALVHRDGTTSARNWLIDLGIEIPAEVAEATAIRGISTEHAGAQGEPPADVLAPGLVAIRWAWARWLPLAGFNLNCYLTLLVHETRRHGLGEFVVAGPLLDPFVLNRYRKGSRKLVDQARHYGVDLIDTHTATADATAAALVASRQVRNG